MRLLGIKFEKLKFLFDLRISLSFVLVVTKMVEKEFLRTPENDSLNSKKVKEIIFEAAMDSTGHGNRFKFYIKSNYKLVFKSTP